MKATGFILLGVPAAVCLLVTSSTADMISLSGAENSRNIAEIRVEDTGVRISLEVFPGDIPFFVDALPDDWLPGESSDRPSGESRLRRFSTEILQVLANGDPLPVKVELVEPRKRVERYSPLAGKVNPFTGQPIPGPPQDKRVLFLDLFYPFQAGDLPDSLTLIPPLGNNDFAAVSIGFILFHNDAPVVDFSSLTEASILDLDWEDPWYSRFRKPSLKRWQDSGMMTYLYIEPYEVRHEVLVRVKDMMPLLDLGLRGDEWIEEDEFRRVEEVIGEFLLQHSNVRIDDQAPPGILDKVNFVQYTRQRTLFLTQPERLRLATAMLGVVVTYFTEGLPQQVTMEWDLFTDRVSKIPANAIDPAGPFPTYLTPDDPVHTWTNFLKTYTIPTVEAVTVDDSLLPPRIPVLSLVLILGLIPLAVVARQRSREEKSPRGALVAGAVLIAVAAVVWPLAGMRLAAAPGPAMTPEQGQLLLDDLLRNVYRAFDLRDEEDVYDKLALTVSGDLLQDIYLQSRRSFVVEQAGGAQAKVEEIAIDKVDVTREETA